VKLEFKQTQTEQLPFDDLKTEQFFTLAIETSNRLGWILGNITEIGFTSYTNNGIFSWNAEVKIRIRNGFADLQSKSREDSVTDVIENKKNIQNFISTFRSLKNTLSPKEPSLMYENLEMNVA
jgi:hypothetical protein